MRFQKREKCLQVNEHAISEMNSLHLNEYIVQFQRKKSKKKKIRKKKKRKINNIVNKILIDN